MKWYSTLHSLNVLLEFRFAFHALSAIGFDAALEILEKTTLALLDWVLGADRDEKGLVHLLKVLLALLRLIDLDLLDVELLNEEGTVLLPLVLAYRELPFKPQQLTFFCMSL
jgi:hypothetical protein